MSKMKKFASILLALVMVFAMSVTAFAADITITGAESGHTYTAYQVFTGTLSDGVLVDIDWGEDVTDSDALLAALLADSTIGSYFTASMTAAQVAEVVADWGDNSTNLSAFAAVVAGYVSGGTASTESDSPYTITGLETGYYLVVDTADNLADGDAISKYIIKVVSDDVTIETKTGTTTFEKEADDVSVEVGQTVNFTLTSTVPDTTYYTTYTWSVSDTMSGGLTFDGLDSITVTIGDTVVTNYDAEVNGNGFTLSIDMTKYTAGQEVVITYTATVNEGAVSVVSTNTAVLTYSNNPNDSTSTDTITDETEVYSAQIVIDKYADSDTTDKLSGAKFVLYKVIEDDPDAEEDESATLYYAYDEDTDAVSWVEDIEDATEVETNSNGAASFIGLEDGTYYLLETEAPAGYNSLVDPITVTINGANATATNTSSLTVTQAINNNSGSSLPSTGGMGTTIFYIVGGVLVLGAAVLLITRKRMDKAE